MNRVRFLESRREAWRTIASMLKRFVARKQRVAPKEAASFPSEYRRLCQDLTLARHRHYGLAIAGELNDLVLAGYHVLHEHRTSALRTVVRFFLVEFPREVRGNGGLLALCTGLFFGPFLLLTLAGVFAPEWVFAVLEPATRATLESNFGNDVISRDEGTDVQMFAFYVWHNVGIDFRMFAGGMLFGLGTLFFLVFNGVVLGASFGFALHAGLAPSFFAFTSGHGSLELCAIVVSGMAGLKLAQGLVAPGRMTRGHALRVRAKEGVRLLAGAAVMTTGAAFVEGFWSSSSFDNIVKYVVGAIGWVVVLLFFAFGGRRAG